jgi:hypothetical protein
MSTDPESRNGFGPYLEGVGPNYRDGDTIRTIRYGEIEDFRRALELHGKDVAAILIEPIQGEAGIVVPPLGYLREVRELCTHHNVLLICDEIQTVSYTQLINDSAESLSLVRASVGPARCCAWSTKAFAQMWFFLEKLSREVYIPYLPCSQTET